MAPAAVPVPMKEYVTFTSTRSLPMPKGWLIPKTLIGTPRLAKALEHLRWHGIKMQEFANDQQLAVERFMIAEITKAPRPFQGHQEVRLVGRWEPDSASFAAGTYVIRAGQPLGILALYLLEPQSDDGLANWNFFDPWIQAGGRFPVPRVPRRIPTPLRQIR